MIGKCNTGGGENLTTQLNNQDAIITELEAKVQSVSGVDMATPVNAQTVTIEQIQESLVDKGAVNKVELVVTPGKDSQEYNADYGTLYSKVTVNGDADLIAENIRDGVNVFGVIGTLVEGVSGIDFGVINTSGLTITIEHSLGVTPSWCAIVPADIASTSYRYMVINGYKPTTEGTATSVPLTKDNKNIIFSYGGVGYPFSARNYVWVALV